MFSASASSSSTCPRETYDVFISFRGEDTRDNFTSHLYAALCRKEIDTFIDNELSKGDEISASLSKAIQDSKISIIIFSKEYASSRWCLQELVKILESKRIYGQIVIPVFYQVNPSDVRNQTGSFAEAFIKHEGNFAGFDKLQSWRVALTEASNLSGWDSFVTRPDSVLVEEIVKDVLKRLNDMSQHVNMDLVGVDTSIKKVELLLSLGSKNVFAVGIWGIGGIGKTTIAKAVFNKISCQFQGSYFMQNIREESEKNGGLNLLRQELVSAILEEGSVGLMFTRKRFSRKKVIVVFDDVTDSCQIETLLEGLDLFGLGSRIIITTRDKQVLKNWGVDKIYKVEGLNYDKAFQLFSQYAFSQNHPMIGYDMLSNSHMIVQYTKGVPLALKVLGSFLLGRGKQDWESALDKLKRTPHITIQKVLRISYDGLDDEEKRIFLDVACFFKERPINVVIEFLNACGFSANIGISVLVDKSLITISSNIISMHDLIQEMGREVVRQESITDPGKRSRLWHHDDIYHVLKENTGTEAIEGISLDMSKMREMHLDAHAFALMHKLRLFQFYNPWDVQIRNKVHVSDDHDIEFASSKLSYLHWPECPLKSFSSKFQLENLIGLDMPNSNFEQLWNGIQNLAKLKYIDLSDSKRLTKCPDLSLATNLDSLILKGCISLVEIPSSTYLNSLTELVLSGCSSLKTFPVISLNTIWLYLDETAIEEVPSSIGNFSKLVMLDLHNCSRLKNLSSSIWTLKSLEDLYLSGCSKLERLPEVIHNLKGMKEFETEGIVKPGFPPAVVPKISMCSLVSLNLTECGIVELPNSLGNLSSLNDLHLSRNNFESVPMSIIDLSNLQHLDIRYCERLQSLPRLPKNLKDIEAQCCTLLESLSDLSSLFKNYVSSTSLKMNFTNCFKLDCNVFRDNVVSDLLKIKSMESDELDEVSLSLFSYMMISMVRTNLGRDNVRTIFPGSEIPEWFSFQSEGSSVTVELPPNSNDREFVGFALCIVLASQDFCDYRWSWKINCACKFKQEDGQSFVVNFHLWDSQDSDGSGSNHILLGYQLVRTPFQNPQWNNNYSSNKASIHFYLLGNGIYQVKKCGAHLL